MNFACTIPHPNELEEFPLSASFNDVYQDHVKHVVPFEGEKLKNVVVRTVIGDVTRRDPRDLENRVDAETEYIREHVHEWFARVSDEDFGDFVRELIGDGQRAFKGYKHDNDSVYMKRMKGMNRFRKGVNQ